MPVRLLVTEGTVADCTQALPLIEGISAECLLADKAYDTNEIVAAALELGMNPVIPPKSNRREKREYDRALYKLRHLVENGFLDFKQWRGVATRYAKNSLSYLAVCQIRAMVIWTRLLSALDCLDSTRLCSATVVLVENGFLDFKQWRGVATRYAKNSLSYRQAFDDRPRSNHGPEGLCTNPPANGTLGFQTEQVKRVSPETHQEIPRKPSSCSR